jgi:hypothetical protein
MLVSCGGEKSNSLLARVAINGLNVVILALAIRKELFARLDLREPAAVSATEIVSLHALSKLATSSTMALRGL